MRILQTVFSIMDYGGIVNYVEYMHQGFQKLGHESEVVLLKHTDRPPKKNKPVTDVAGSYKSSTANMVNAATGWYGIPVYGYKGEEAIETWKEYAEQFDIIFHQIPVPKPDPEGWWRWVYDLDNPIQVAIEHDSHFRDRYPHLIDVVPALDGIIAVSYSHYRCLDALPLRRMYLGNPHKLEDWDNLTPWKKRKKQFASAHVWKAWKHMDNIVRVIPLLDKSVKNVVAGDGIEARYMRSKDKCKPKYKGIWKKAIKHGMDYRGLIGHEELYDVYRNSRVMVDLSFSKKFAQFGNHVNRSIYEGYNAGCVPLCDAGNMEEPGSPKPLFADGKTHVSLPNGYSIQDLADGIHDTLNMHPDDANRIVENGRSIVSKYFEYVHCAKEAIRFAQGEEKVGVFRKTEVGTLTEEVQSNRDRYIDEIENG